MKKEEVMDLSNRDNAFRWMVNTNLNFIVRAHSHINWAIKGRAEEILSFDDLSAADKNYWNHEYKVQFSSHTVKTTFLVIFSYLEEMLHLIWKTYNPNNISTEQGYGISKYKTFMKSVLGIDVGSHNAYQKISEAQLVRNSLLHAAGRISLMQESKSKKLLKLIEKRPNYYKNKSDRIKLTPEGLISLEQSVRTLLEELMDKAIPTKEVE
ncbi:hypothetical protein FLL45_01675 [Aliikangiella marina]|uniref:Cthe-2314-like HEPN domain-containing protein n=1 Tax=Aliikangiella marina TaxID=1712262 RepID=A0A545THL2_9GAMM|nr:hypothetical protein [Aliikangiella marina]TQV76695.1 hypothetical protein FLL45_01675 [Aliikangiella marina]